MIFRGQNQVPRCLGTTLRPFWDQFIVIWVRNNWIHFFNFFVWLFFTILVDNLTMFLFTGRAGTKSAAWPFVCQQHETEWARLSHTARQIAHTHYRPKYQSYQPSQADEKNGGILCYSGADKKQLFLTHFNYFRPNSWPILLRIIKLWCDLMRKSVSRSLTDSISYICVCNSTL